MEFNKKNYIETKNKVDELIKQQLDWKNGEGFILDGIVCPDIYEKQDLKVLVMLGESYGYADTSGLSIEHQPKDDILGVRDSKKKTARKIPALLWPVFQSLEEGKKMTFDDCPDFFLNNDEYYKDLQNTLSKIAWVNVKKISRDDGTKQDYKEIYDSCFINSEILKLQIDSISPDLIIVCSDPVFDGLYDAELLGEGIDYKKNVIQTNHLGQKIIQVNHPGHFGSWGYESIYKLYETIYESVLNNKE
jgi:hypothetical protein